MNRLKKHILSKVIHVGDDVKWQYKHHMNSKSFTMRVKRGVVVAMITSKKSGAGYMQTLTEYCKVHFEGNKNPSRVLISELNKRD